MSTNPATTPADGPRGATVLAMSMSLDGFIAGPNAGIDIGSWPLVTYLDDVETAMSRAKQAAGGKDVLVHGASVAQLALAAGVLDELELHVVPVLLGQGRRLFGGEAVELERTRVLEGEGGVTHLRYRVAR
jgi:dihydrofolate reductase